MSNQQNDWYKHFPYFLMAYRSPIKSNGQTPARILGREISLPCDLAFECKPEEFLAGDDYVKKLWRKIFTKRFNLISRLLVIV